MYFYERTGMIEADSSEALRKACQYELQTESPNSPWCKSGYLKQKVV